ncbi:hypothetical protein AMATHDRAFT_63604 [Amanita thiersii Skay4041]|uniref:Uncharacterized protein n=1 Tax=Amanita thiersii Skay4041 TaxID=703135 RepID=A0A2A9NNG8_9AGAR|nr:hypothetical protein AMATHDRAFT_63604 [Amanita thiersii Skay4041]
MVLEDIKESVRLLAAGLSITSPSVNITTTDNSTRSPTPRIYTHNKSVSTNLSTTRPLLCRRLQIVIPSRGSPSSSYWRRRSLETSLSESSASSNSVSPTGLED